MKIGRRKFLELSAAAPLLPVACARKAPSTLHVVPNFHPAVMGWLAPYHVERNYCVYGYIAHQDHAKRDPNYRYVMSEIPHAITMMERQPERFEELKELIRQGKSEIVNAFVVEPTVNLSGGEALVMQGVQGLRWYEQVMGLRPRHCWMIDVVGWHEQMAQIVRGLGLESFEYSRYNPTGEADSPHGIAEQMESIHWIESPDGSRTLAVNPSHYFDTFTELMRAEEALPEEEVRKQISETIALQKSRFPSGAPLLGFAGQEDYSLPFKYQGYPTELLEIWEATQPETRVRFSTFSEWFDEFFPRAKAGEFDLTTVRSGSRIYGWSGFWVNAPQVKRRYRDVEHRLQSSESWSAVASLLGDCEYPSQELADAWFLMALNMDRNILWAAGVHGTYEHEASWDMVDRFDAVDDLCETVDLRATSELLEEAENKLTIYNPSSWNRTSPLLITLPSGRTADVPVQLLEDGKTALMQAELPPLSVTELALRAGTPNQGTRTAMPASFENDFYVATLDPETAALSSLRLKPSDREMFAGPANVIQASKRVGQDAEAVFAHSIPPMRDREVITTSDAQLSRVHVREGSLATIVEATCPFQGAELRRVIRFYRDSPRVDFHTETNDVSHGTVIAALFPLAEDVMEIRRGIPYGFSHGAWKRSDTDLPGRNDSIVPVIRWSHYAVAGGGGLALLDRGVPAREIDGNTVAVLLQNATHIYYWEQDSRWISGDGMHSFDYALLAHEVGWKEAGIPQEAWDFNAAPLLFSGHSPKQVASFVKASQNLILQALRRTGEEIEIRFMECLGYAGEARITISLPHSRAELTDLVGGNREAVIPETEGESSIYRFPVRAQQIVTLRLKASISVAEVESHTTFDPLVPREKRAATKGFDYPSLAGHPPRTREGVEDEWMRILEEREDL